MKKHSYFSNNLDLFFKIGREGGMSTKELINKKNELHSIHKQMLFVNDIENAKLRGNLRKIKLNQISTKEEMLESTEEYRNLVEENNGKLEKLNKMCQNKVSDLKEQLDEKINDLENDIREEEVKSAMIIQDIEKLRSHEAKFYSKCAEYEMYQRALKLKKECEDYQQQIDEISQK